MTIGLKVSENFKQKLINLAQMENRNLSSWMLNALITYAKEHQDADLKYEEVLKDKTEPKK